MNQNKDSINLECQNIFRSSLRDSPGIYLCIFFIVNIRQGKAKPRLLKLILVFHHLPSVGSKQLCALAHLGCTREAGTS